MSQLRRRPRRPRPGLDSQARSPNLDSDDQSPTMRDLNKYAGQTVTSERRTQTRGILMGLTCPTPLQSKCHTQAVREPRRRARSARLIGRSPMIRQLAVRPVHFAAIASISSFQRGSSSWQLMTVNPEAHRVQRIGRRRITGGHLSLVARVERLPRLTANPMLCWVGGNHPQTRDDARV